MGDGGDDDRPTLAGISSDGTMRNGMASANRTKQLRDWEASETNRNIKLKSSSEKRVVRFPDGCVFLAACASGDTDEVSKLLEQGADIDTTNVDGLTALHQAVIDENLDMVQFLITSGANVDAQDNEGWTALHAAVSCGFGDIVKCLIDEGADMAMINSDGELPIDLADLEEMIDFLNDQIHRRGINLDMERQKEERIMLEDAMDWLQNGQVRDRLHQRTGATALHVAAAKGYIKVMNILLQAGAPVDAVDREGWTPLQAAAHWGEQQACEILVEHLADMNKENFVGQTVMDVADSDMLPFLEELKKRQAMIIRERPLIESMVDNNSPLPYRRNVSVEENSASHRNSVTRMPTSMKHNKVTKADERKEGVLLRNSNSSSDNDNSDNEAPVDQLSPMENEIENDVMEDPDPVPPVLRGGVLLRNIENIPPQPGGLSDANKQQDVESGSEDMDEGKEDDERSEDGLFDDDDRLARKRLSAPPSRGILPIPTTLPAIWPTSAPPAISGPQSASKPTPSKVEVGSGMESPKEDTTIGSGRKSPPVSLSKRVAQEMANIESELQRKSSVEMDRTASVTLATTCASSSAVTITAIPSSPTSSNVSRLKPADVSPTRVPFPPSIVPTTTSSHPASQNLNRPSVSVPTNVKSEPTVNVATPSSSTNTFTFSGETNNSPAVSSPSPASVGVPVLPQRPVAPSSPAPNVSAAGGPTSPTGGGSGKQLPTWRLTGRVAANASSLGGLGGSFDDPNGANNSVGSSRSASPSGRVRNQQSFDPGQSGTGAGLRSVGGGSANFATVFAPAPSVKPNHAVSTVSNSGGGGSGATSTASYVAQRIATPIKASANISAPPPATLAGSTVASGQPGMAAGRGEHPVSGSPPVFAPSAFTSSSVIGSSTRNSSATPATTQSSGATSSVGQSGTVVNLTVSSSSGYRPGSIQLLSDVDNVRWRSPAVSSNSSSRSDSPTIGGTLVSASVVSNRKVSFVPPSRRDEESESERKSHARRVRETRRSTQGVTLDQLKTAEEMYTKKREGEDKSKTQETEAAENNASAASTEPPRMMTIATCSAGTTLRTSYPGTRPTASLLLSANRRTQPSAVKPMSPYGSAATTTYSSISPSPNLHPLHSSITRISNSYASGGLQNTSASPAAFSYSKSASPSYPSPVTLPVILPVVPTSSLSSSTARSTNDGIHGSVGVAASPDLPSASSATLSSARSSQPFHNPPPSSTQYVSSPVLLRSVTESSPALQPPNRRPPGFLSTSWSGSSMLSARPAALNPAAVTSSSDYSDSRGHAHLSDDSTTASMSTAVFRPPGSAPVSDRSATMSAPPEFGVLLRNPRQVALAESNAESRVGAVVSLGSTEGFSKNASIIPADVDSAILRSSNNNNNNSLDYRSYNYRKDDELDVSNSNIPSSIDHDGNGSVPASGERLNSTSASKVLPVNNSGIKTVSTTATEVSRPSNPASRRRSRQERRPTGPVGSVLGAGLTENGSGDTGEPNEESLQNGHAEEDKVGSGDDRKSLSGYRARYPGISSLEPSTASSSRVSSSASLPTSASSHAPVEVTGSGPSGSDFRKLYEQERNKNDILASKIRNMENQVEKLKLEKLSETKVNGALAKGSGSLVDKDRKSLERRITELEEELKQIESLRADNQRLKEENGALIRVISKLSK